MWLEKARWTFNKIRGSGYYPVPDSLALQIPGKGSLALPLNLAEGLSRASRDPNLIINPTPYAIDLGFFGSLSEGLSPQPITSSSKEWSSAVCINEAGQFWWPKTAEEGGELSVERKAYDADEDFVPVRRHIMNMHSHGKLDTPIHIEDAGPLFSTSISYLSTAAELVITPSIKMLALRTSKTPVVGIFNGDIKINQILESRGLKSIAERYREISKEIGESDYSIELIRQRTPEIMFGLCSMFEALGIAVYSGNRNTNIVTRIC